MGEIANPNAASLLESLGSMARLFRACKEQLGSFVYRCNGRVPFAHGYGAYRDCYLRRFVGERDSLRLFQEGRELPDGFGLGLDERVVEYPWILSRLMGCQRKSRFLDAGATLNHDMILEHQLVKPHKWTVLTLAPERECLWNLGVSYVYDDLRSNPFREGWFDGVFCVSVIEHVGMDNHFYTSDRSYRESRPRDYLLAIDEIRRVLRPNGRLFLTVPFGAHEDRGWLQQFDSAMLSTLALRFGGQAATKSFFRYTPLGWKTATEGECEGLSYFDIHAARFSKAEIKADGFAFGAAACAVACLELQK